MSLLTSDGVLIADEVLAKHDENYMPPEVTKALKDSGQLQDNGQLPASGQAQPGKSGS